MPQASSLTKQTQTNPFPCESVFSVVENPNSQNANVVFFLANKRISTILSKFVKTLKNNDFHSKTQVEL